MRVNLFRVSRCLVFLVLALVASALLAPAPATQAQGQAGQDDDPAAPISSMPGAFIQNVGQWHGENNSEVKFQYRRSGLEAWFLPSRVAFAALGKRSDEGPDTPTETASVEAHVINMDFVDPVDDGSVKVEGLDRLPGDYNYMIGPVYDWAQEAPSFSRMVYRGIWPNVDAYFTSHASAQASDLPTFEEDRQEAQFFLKSTYVVRPGGSPDRIRLRYDAGAGEEISLTAAGILRVTTQLGEYYELAPTAFQFKNGQREVVDVDFRLDGDVLSFDVAPYDAASTLYIDPSIIFSRRIGGNSTDNLVDLEEDATGRYILGITFSTTGLPVTGGFQTIFGGSVDWYAAKFSVDNNTLLWATYLGGGSSDYADEFVVVNGEMVMVGHTLDSTALTDFPGSNGLPIVPPITAQAVAPFAMSYRTGQFNCTIARLGVNGNTLPFSTSFGPSFETYASTLVQSTHCMGIAQAPDGTFYVVGSSTSTTAGGAGNDGWPVVGAFQPDNPTTGTATDVGIVFKFSPFVSSGGQVQNFTWLGQGSTNWLVDVKMDPIRPGSPVVAGHTTATTINPLAFTANIGPVSTASGIDNYIANFSPTLSSVNYLTRLGGNSTDSWGGGTTSETSASFSGGLLGTNILQVRSDGTVLGGANTSSTAGVATQFPVTAGTFQQTPSTLPDMAVYILNNVGSALVASTFLGGTSSDFVRSMGFDSQNNIYVVGCTLSADFPTTFGEVQPSLNVTTDAFRTIFNSSLTGPLRASTYLGGTSTDWANKVVVDTLVAGRATVGGSTQFVTTTPLFPTTGPDFGVLAGQDMFVTRLDAQITSAAAFTDLAVTKTGPTSIIAGQALTYNLTSVNNGPLVALDVIIRDTLPANVRFISATPSAGGICTVTGQVVQCRWAGATTVGQARTVAIRVRACAEAQCNTTLSNSALTFQDGGLLFNTISNEPFATGPNTYTINNNATNSSSWQFRNELNPCIPTTSNLGAGHTLFGQMRWGSVTTCTDYGNVGDGSVAAGNYDFIQSSTINTAACLGNLQLGFKYYIDFQESATFDQAVVSVNILNGTQRIRAAGNAGLTGGVGGLTLIDDTITNNASPQWRLGIVNLSTLAGIAGSIPAGIAIEFGGATTDGIGNLGNGFNVDDVQIGCDQPFDPNPLNNSAVFNTAVQTQSQFTMTKTANRREVVTGNEVTYTIVANNLGPSNANGMVIRDTLPGKFQFIQAITSRGTCTATTPVGSNSTIVTCNVGVLGAPADAEGQRQCATTLLPTSVTVRIRARAATNLSEATAGCPEGLVNNLAEITTTNCLPNQGTFSATAATCVVPAVNPNAQLGCQVHLPILNFQGQDDVCESMIEVQLLGCTPSKAVLITWGEPGFCPPQASGPLKVECTGLLVPGASWIIQDAQVPTGSKSGILFKFTAQQLSEVGLADDLGFDDVVADLMCEELFFGVVGDADDYRRFKKAYNEGSAFRGIPQDIAMGEGALAVEVLRRCPGDLTPGVDVTSKYNGIAGDHLGRFDSIFGGFSYYVPLIYADKAGLNTVMYIQNGGLECSSLEIWFKAQDDCLRARICDVTTLAPGESYQYDATDCVGPDWQGSAWIRASEPMGIAVDIYGRDVLMTYIAEPAPFNYIVSTDDNPDFKLFRPGNRVLFGPLIYSEYQGWDTGVQVQNIDPSTAAKVKVYFLDRSGDIITTLVDWICPRGSQTYFLPVVAGLPGSWVGSIRVESQDWWAAGTTPVRAPSLVGVAQLIKYNDAARTNTEQAMAYSLLPEHKAYNWQVGYADGGLDQGVGLIAIPSFLKDLDGDGVTTEVAIMNLAEKPGFTDFAIFVYDQNGLIDYVCQKLHDRQVEYIDLQTWGYVGAGFKGSAIISATFWEHDVFNPTGEFVRNLVGLGAVSVERTNTRLGTEVPGDEAAGDRGIPFRNDLNLEFCFPNGVVPICPGQPIFGP